MSDQPSASVEDLDYLSQLPRDCLLSSFSLLNRYSLNELECVSEALRAVVHDPSLQKIKKTGKLFIYEQRSGHSFHFKLDKSDQCLRYHIDRSDPSARGVRSGGLYVKDPNAITKAGLSLDAIVDGDAITAVPHQLFDNIARLFLHHAARFTLFERIRIDNDFLDNYSRIAQGTVENWLRFEKVKIDDSMDPMKFSEFLLSMNLSYLSMDIQDFNDPTDYSRIARLFDADFISKFFNIPTNNEKRLTILLGKVQYSWSASRELLPMFIQCHTLNIQFMKVDPELVIELVMISLETAQLKSYYFGLTRELTTEDVNKIGTAMYSIKRTFESYPQNEYTTYVINKIGTNLACRLWMCFGVLEHLIISADIDYENEG